MGGNNNSKQATDSVDLPVLIIWAHTTCRSHLLHKLNWAAAPSDPLLLLRRAKCLAAPSDLLRTSRHRAAGKLKIRSISATSAADHRRPCPCTQLSVRSAGKSTKSGALPSR